MGKVYLTGAGPGDIELLTLKALRVVKMADAILYDRLANPEILSFAKERCELIYVGKEDSHHTLPQEEINALLYQAACRYEHVVRLKGGDPLVFGRGAEEGLYLRERGVDIEFIPGVTSAVAVPECVGIPVTHRGTSSSFCVVTGHGSKKSHSQIAWEHYKGIDTVVFLMGLNNIEKITQKLIEIGRPRESPVAVISRGTMPDERVVTGTLEDIYEKAKGLPAPALIVVGEVVKLREQLDWFEK